MPRFYFARAQLVGSILWSMIVLVLFLLKDDSILASAFSVRPSQLIQLPVPSSSSSRLSLLPSSSSPYYSRPHYYSRHLTTTTTTALFADVSWTNTDVWVFVIGIIPFAWATVEFWRRIAVGESFGTGKDRIYFIGTDGVPQGSRGRQTLDSGAFVVAYILFGIAAGILGLTLYSVYTSPNMIVMVDPITMMTDAATVADVAASAAASAMP